MLDLDELVNEVIDIAELDRNPGIREGMIKELISAYATYIYNKGWDAAHESSHAEG